MTTPKLYSARKCEGTGLFVCVFGAGGEEGYYFIAHKYCKRSMVHIFNYICMPRPKYICLQTRSCIKTTFMKQNVYIIA